MASGLPPLEWGTVTLDGAGGATVETKFRQVESVAVSEGSPAGTLVTSISGRQVVFSAGTPLGLVNYIIAGQQ